MARWNIIFAKGKTYQQTITLDGVADIASATNWQIDCAFPNEAPFLQASTANGLLQAGLTNNQKIMVIPAATTALFDTGNGRFDFYIEWAGGVKRPYYIGGNVQVLPYAGEVSP
jgi:hypothetical protein